MYNVFIIVTVVLDPRLETIEISIYSREYRKSLKIHTMENFTSMKKNEIPLNATIGLGTKIIMLSKRSQT